MPFRCETCIAPAGGLPQTIAATRPQHPWRSYPESPRQQVHLLVDL